MPIFATEPVFDQSWAQGTGLVAGTQTRANHLELLQGAGIFTPESDIVIMTKQGTVKIAGKSTAVVWASGTETLIYNLNDNHLGDVSVIVGKQKIVVPLGSQLVLAKNTNFKELNAKARIAFRNGSSFEFAQTA